MHERQLQWMVHGPAIANLAPEIAYAGVTIARVANRNDVFVDLVVDPDARPGSFALDFVRKRKATHLYRLLARQPGASERQAVA